VTGLTDATPMTEVRAVSPSIRMPANATAAPSHDGTNGVSAHTDAPLRLEEYLARQSDCTRRLFRALDHGIRTLASDITAKVMCGRRSVGGMSYYTPERQFFCADFLRTGDGLTLSIFTGGQRWEGLNPLVGCRGAIASFARRPTSLTPLPSPKRHTRRESGCGVGMHE
jgi:hypothetical protein